ncbi:MAG: hypothetical protein A3A96_00565 [Candidatus Zambryskibacteria bacterium RIFCSPLOWO2_01_FULL_39_39]|uniref:Nucleotide-diphospho-sugar transferase domain-containing protein n=1 Tax=Candidatus Zambryskibacteria bacterium RIFCSPLOWO2_01_FULL_39_39 TaxID=1802758 RepID=A0A1G2TXN1_9BACT|nr:MAG: hypothetical protein UT00_C0004G0008 [Parcubacteria group bacterium GW2011_GWA1_38_7]OHA87799.1 MAG: hypothetical protein A2644_01330 [Candidatus Zambryskibacteria bacterium RIFCSPHIGHO2_01_FULL_39_63]OHA94976.1 MAG: hypothetical protein A3B88_01185 [Candidatus Zambryskibacteria bacterium RIFCSPHIGHO2_02_FULL_39_19]OHA99157.1 MAG: hypothetical protein A3F20_03135 [Candidatus Zambryskibacteria bacterium RIFCSPHIGHO2_12_FULL_39_21]OHB01919.1 MAG: hypothetical protein A3A96_00565 [Candidat
MSINNLTVLYYSANTEDPIFEANIRKKLIANMGDLPLVSVTQEPALDFGKNICVGKHHACYGNEFRQIQIGLKEVKTDYVITAEADVLYPPEYFKFQPTRGDCYRYGNIWLSYIRPQDDSQAVQRAFFKKYSDGAQIMRKDFWLDFIRKMIGDEDKWFTEENKPRRIRTPKTDPKFIWMGENPVVTFKTLNNVSRFSSRLPIREYKPVTTLPYWGDVGELIKNMIV